MPISHSLTRLNHPHIVSFLPVGATAAGAIARLG